jgi:UDP-glucose 4-epimerase
VAQPKIIVTGGAGYIGSHTVVDLAAKGYEPILLDDFSNSKPLVVDRLRELCDGEIRCHEVDCRDRAAVAQVFAKEGPIAGVIHFAALKAVGESQQNPVAYYANNVGSLLSLLEVMAEFKVRDLVFSSSCTVYGEAAELPVTEETRTAEPASVYGATKKICEQILRDTVASGAPLRATRLRYFNPIGAHPSARIGELPLGDPQNLVPVILQSVAGLRGPVQIFGGDWSTPDGTCIRDYIHVLDLAEAHVKCLAWMTDQPEAPLLETLNIGTGRGVSVREAIAAFEQATGESVEVSVAARRDGDIEQIYASVEKAERVLGWKAERSLEEAMRDAWRWQSSLGASG